VIKPLLELFHERREIEQPPAHAFGNVPNAFFVAVSLEHLQLSKKQLGGRLIAQNRQPVQEVLLRPSLQSGLFVGRLQEQMEMVPHETPRDRAQAAKLQLFVEKYSEPLLLLISEEQVPSSHPGDDVKVRGFPAEIADVGLKGAWLSHFTNN